MFPFAAIHAPLESVFPCLMSAVLPIMFLYLMNKSVMGEIGCGIAMLMAGTAIYLIYVLWAIKDPYFHFTAIGGIISLGVGLPILTFFSDKLDDKMLEADAIRNCYQQIRMNPQNAMAAFRLAQILYKKGDKHVAVAIGSNAILSMPKSRFMEEHNQLHFWSRNIDPSAVSDVVCVACHKDAPASALICPNCLGSLHLERALKGKVRSNRNFTKGVSVWIVAVVSLLAIPLLGQFPAGIAIPSIIAVIAVALYALYVAFGLGMKK
ncbi:MAG TPA: hypothetical protein VK171_08135 [Fimbriimonas sp.]|nr:hypothetical protein [Fimbriimonas sp.]